MKYCHECGYKLTLGTEKFCPNCGVKLNGERHDETKIGITNTQGDIIGVGVDGDGNIITKEFSVVINEYQEDCGLTLIHPKHFKENTDIKENVIQWRKQGYQLSLESIYDEQEFRRDRTLKEIKGKLEDKKRLLLLGESGTSKTTILKELICDYFKETKFKVLYNLGDDGT